MGNKSNTGKRIEKIALQDQSVCPAEMAYEMRKIIRSYFPDFQSRLARLPDHRKRKAYRTEELVCAAIGMFILKAQSRNAINNDRRHSNEFKSNFGKLFKCELPHLDGVQDFFEVLSPSELEKVKVDLISRLIENKVFYKYKIAGHYMVAVDATGVISCQEDRFGCGLRKESKNGKVSYLYPVLEAKLVTSNGLCIPLATEWIVNDNNKPYDKQDCEQKAFKRLAVKLKKAFPRLPICILADALYASDPVMGICEDNEWKYLITLQEGSLPALQDCLADDPPTHRNSFTHRPPSRKEHLTITHQFYWVEDLLHKKHTLHYLQCKEILYHEKTNKTITQNFVRITNLPTNKATIKNLSTAGRLRWKIENEGFNEQKNNGYAMEHLYSRKSFNALQNYYQAMLIAHLINQLLEQSCYIQNLQERFSKLTLKYLWQQFLAAMKCLALCSDRLEAIDSKKHQVRLNPG